MNDSDLGKILVGESSHDGPGGARAGGLAAAAECSSPCVHDSRFEFVDGLTVSWDCVVVQPPTNYRGQPASLLDDGQRPVFLERLAYSLHRCSQSLGHRGSDYRETII